MENISLFLYLRWTILFTVKNFSMKNYILLRVEINMDTIY